MPPSPQDASLCRRSLLLAGSAALATGAAACTSGTPNRQGTSTGGPATPQAQFAALERTYSARLGARPAPRSDDTA